MKIRALATVALLAASLTACGEADEAPQDDAVSAEDIGDDGTYGDEPEPDTEPESDFARGDAVASSTEYLESVGVTDELVQQLAAVGQVNNYGLSVEKPMTEFEKQGLAVGQVMNCQDVNGGDRTYEDLMNDDMSTGATHEQVSAMYGFLEVSFCPHVKPDPAS